MFRNKPYFAKRNIPECSEMMHQIQNPPNHKGSIGAGICSAASGTKMYRKMNTGMMKFCSGTSPGLPAGSPPASPGGLMTLTPSRPPFDLKLFALCSQYHGLDQICNKKMHSKINNFRHRESKSVRIYKGRGAFQTNFFFSETLASGTTYI